MNDTLLLRVSQEIVGRPLLILPEKLSVIAGLLAERIGIAPSFKLDAPRPEVSRFVGSAVDEDRRVRLPYARTPEGVGIITVTGSLLNRGAWVGSYSGTTSYEGIKHQLAAAVADPKVGAILLDIESPGGQATGAFELAAAVRAARAVKPVDAVVNGMAASAAYALASGARRIITSPSGISGSIGVVLMHADHSRALDKAGITPTFIHAGARKVDGNSVQPLSDDARAALQAEVDSLYDIFTKSVAEGRGRKLTAKAARDTEAGIFTGQAAVDAGLADTVGTFEEALDSLTRSLRGRRAAPTTTRSTAMLEFSQADLDRETAAARADEAGKTAAAVETAKAEGRAEGATAERARIESILTCEEAKGRVPTASHFALKTAMTVDEAKGALAGVALVPQGGARSNSSPIGLVIDSSNKDGAEATKPKLDHTAIFGRLAAAEGR